MLTVFMAGLVRAMIVLSIIPVSEIDDRIVALVFLVVLFLWDCRFHFCSAFRIMNLE
jgi:hypothetical protein